MNYYSHISFRVRYKPTRPPCLCVYRHFVSILSDISWIWNMKRKKNWINTHIFPFEFPTNAQDPMSLCIQAFCIYFERHLMDLKYVRNTHQNDKYGTIFFEMCVRISNPWATSHGFEICTHISKKMVPYLSFWCVFRTHSWLHVTVTRRTHELQLVFFSSVCSWFPERRVSKWSSEWKSESWIMSRSLCKRCSRKKRARTNVFAILMSFPMIISSLISSGMD